MCHVNALRAIAFRKRHRNLDYFDVAVLVAIAILHRVFRVEFQLKQRHTERRRYGVRPGDVLVEPDRDKVS